MDIQIEWVELYNPYSSTISLSGWKIKTSKGKKNLWGIVPAKGWWVVINVVIKLPNEIIGKELLDNFSDEVELINKEDYTVDKVAYHNYGVPWRAWEKNDPRAREFAGYMVGGSPWFRNWHWMPEVGGYTSEQAMADFYVKNKPFACVGEVGYIHTGRQWKTISLDRQGDWSVLDKITTSFPPDKPVKGRININTASKDVLLSLPGIDEKLAEQIIKYCDGENGPFDEIGEICQVVGMQRLGINGLDDDEDGYVDEDDENEIIIRRISNLITVRSNCFTVICLGKVVKEGRVLAEKKIKVVVDRGSLPVRILYYRELYD
ncbi:helix-hairpin-helix domain-containing protein [Candidatus Aerophobetes bacterium]|nr:helix-hairpin-helix domain-containing protein [Candidatus Aerophobetes bacterium]